MWCVFHNAQWYWSDNLCKLVTDQRRGSLGVCDSESYWFTEEIGTYMRCWESPGDLLLVIENFISFRSFRCAPLRKDIKFLSLVEDHPVFPKNVCKKLLLFLVIWIYLLFCLIYLQNFVLYLECYLLSPKMHKKVSK